MERIEVITRAASALRTELPGPHDALSGVETVHGACAALRLHLQPVAEGDVMLGGAYSRLQLWSWDRPTGGIIWLRRDLEPAERTFAIAHELGHYVLHRGEGISLHPPCEPRDVDEQADPSDLRREDRRVEEYTPRNRRELEANAFAAELLAPRAEVRRLFTGGHGVDATTLAARCGIARTLAARRLIDAVLAPETPNSHGGGAAAEGAAAPPPAELIAQLDEGQRAAARTPGPALVVAGPGTGKTATLVGRVAHLVAERGVPPERVLALTFSNRAAGEMRERLANSGLPGERMPIMTLHAFAASLLREYAPRVPHAPDEAPLTPEFRILDETDAYLLMEELLGALPLRFYRSLGNPTAHLRTLLADFSHARDALLTPAGYLELVEEMAALAQQAPGEPYTEEHVARARERALAYGVWDRELRRRGLLDFGGLIQRAVELLRADAAALEHVRARYPEVLVDEFQDTNRAAAVLLFAVAGDTGTGLWVVGDRNQSIYRWRGASPANLPRLVERYPHLRVRTLRHCYRSVPDIVRLGSAIAARMADLAPAPTEPEGATDLAGVEALRQAQRPLELLPVRPDGAGPAIQREDGFSTATHERLGLAAAIQRQRARGFGYADQAVLCRTHKQTHQIAAILTSQGIPVSQQGDFFSRDEIKDALMLVALAAGPDARGVLRAGPLLLGLGYPQPAPSELAHAARALAARRLPLPGALRNGAALSAIPFLSATTRTGLAALGEVAAQLRNATAVAPGLANYLLRPGGYAWQLARIADRLDPPHTGAEPLPGMSSPARAQQALAALGALVRLAWRFDLRWLREPDFRARLSHAVMHRRAPAVPDALEAAQGADVTPAGGTAAATRLSAAPPDAPNAPVVRCFLHQVAAMRAAEATVPLPPTEEDAVQLLTLHQSKGLEFPIVYLPGLAQGQFPAAGGGPNPICPPGFRESDLPGEEEAEERCLFYVGVTRARDHVAFTRAAAYTRATRHAPPSVLLRLLEGLTEVLVDTPLLGEGEVARLAEAALAIAVEDEGDDPAGVPDSLQVGPPASKRTFDLHALEQYSECPLQYKYANIYDLLDPAENAVRRFHRYIRRGAQALRELHAQAPATAWPAAETHLQALWERDGPAGHAYDAFYWQAAQEILRADWQAITDPVTAADASRVLLAQTLRAELAHCVVEVQADRMIESPLPGTSLDAPPLTVLVRLHTGRPRSADKEDLALPLYYLAQQQRQPGAPLRIALTYAGAPLREGAGPASEPPPGALEDVTAIARKDAEKYARPGRRERSRLDKLDEAARGIAAGRFTPRPEERRCAACAFYYVCPADSPEVAAPPLASTEPRR